MAQTLGHKSHFVYRNTVQNIITNKACQFMCQISTPEANVSKKYDQIMSNLSKTEYINNPGKNNFLFQKKA